MSNGAETTDGFLGLPTELRLQIYGYIADTVPIPTSSTMEPYQGLVLSCRRVYHEFESEAVKSVNQFLKASKAKWTTTLYNVLIPHIQTFVDTITITIKITGHIPPAIQLPRYHCNPLYYPHLATLIHNFIDNLPSFRLCMLKVDSPIVDVRFAYDCRSPSYEQQLSDMAQTQA
ncbi:hypothetical protein HBI44_074090 [Parastagonospora nodorum]|nr:hypothetical protein HBI44_074090 [Parastagonospora nodorum]